jgi:hypothetical protein
LYAGEGAKTPGAVSMANHCSSTHRRVMAAIAAITSRFDLPG